MSKNTVKISYFSDILCIWAYVAQIRLQELKSKYQEKIEITPYHVTLFGDTEQRIAQGWKDKGGYLGFGQHILEVAEKFPHIDVNPDVWKSCQPLTSGTAHLFLKSVQLLAQEHPQLGQEITGDKSLLKQIEWDVRLAFFRDARDISDYKVLYDIANIYSVDKKMLEKYLNNGSAMALFCSEMAMKERYKLEGSPTYILNNNRQRLFGNVGYKIMQANVAELLNDDGIANASWC